MNRRLLALALAATAALGLTACAPTASPSGGAVSDRKTTNTQSVGDACSAVQSAMADAGTELSSFDPAAAAADPQKTIDSLTALAGRVGTALGSIDNQQVYDAGAAVQKGFTDLGDVLQKFTVDKDLSAVSRFPAIQADLTAAITGLSKLCTAG